MKNFLIRSTELNKKKEKEKGKFLKTKKKTFSFLHLSFSLNKLKEPNRSAWLCNHDTSMSRDAFLRKLEGNVFNVANELQKKK